MLDSLESSISLFYRSFLTTNSFIYTLCSFHPILTLRAQSVAHQNSSISPTQIVRFAISITLAFSNSKIIFDFTNSSTDSSSLIRNRQNTKPILLSLHLQPFLRISIFNLQLLSLSLSFVIPSPTIR